MWLGGPLVLLAALGRHVDLGRRPRVDELADRPLVGPDRRLGVAPLEQLGQRPAGGALRRVGAELARAVLAGLGVDAVDPHDPLVTLLPDRRATGGLPRHATLDSDTEVIHRAENGRRPRRSGGASGPYHTW